MISAEQTHQPILEKTPSPPRERDPLQLDREVEEQKAFFQRRLAYYEAALAGVLPDQEKLQKLTKKAIHSSSDAVEQATDFFALASVAEKLRTNGRHSPTWEQAAAAIHIVFPYESRQAQRIKMATGEGKTFTIAIATLWKAVRGESVNIYTDKDANVEQSYLKTKPLYELFQVHSETVLNVKKPDELFAYYQKVCREKRYVIKLTKDNVGELYGFYLQNPPAEVRIDTLASFVHEALARQQLIFQAEAFLRGDMAIQRSGQVTLSEVQRTNIQTSLDNQKRWMKANAAILDEGDMPLDTDDSAIVISEKDPQGFTEADKAGFTLAWELFKDQQPTTQEQPGTIDRIAAATGYESNQVKDVYEVTPTHEVEGVKADDVRERITANTVTFVPEVFFAAKLLEASVTPKLLSESLRLLLLQFQTGQRADLPLPPEVLNALADFADSATSTQNELDLANVATILPPPTKLDVRRFLNLDAKKENTFFDHSQTTSAHPELSRILAADQAPLSDTDRQKLETIFGGEYQRMTQQLTLFKVMESVKLITEPLLTKYNHDIFQVKYLMKKGNDYQIVGDGEDQKIEVLGADRQPQPGKEFQDTTQVFINLMNGLPLPEPQKTVAQIMPQTWFAQLSQSGTEVTSISATQRWVNYNVRSTGEGVADVRPTRVLGTKEQKLRAIVDYIADNKDIPILVCVQDVEELIQLQAELGKLAGRNLEVLDAQHADEANQKVPGLESGKILLLQITARGLDFGHFLEDGQHSFENGLIVSASPLPDPHQQQQTEGRLGGKRANGRVVTFTSLDDELAQKFYAITPERSQERHTQLAEIDTAFQEMIATVDTHQTAFRWPQSYSEAVVMIENWRADEAKPVWMQFMLNDPQTPSELQDQAKKMSSQFAALLRRYEALSEGHISTIGRQQENNMKQKYENRRQQMIVDVVIQNLWRTVMNPTSETPVGRALLPLTHEERQAVMERVFEEANDIYPLAIYQLKPDELASHYTEERNKMAVFMKELTEHVLVWVELEKLDHAYSELQKRNQAEGMKYALPTSVHELGTWLENYPVPKPQRRDIWEKLRNLGFLGSGLRNTLTSQQTAPIQEFTTEDELLLTLRDIAAAERQISRKIQAII